MNVLTRHHAVIDRRRARRHLRTTEVARTPPRQHGNIARIDVVVERSSKRFASVWWRHGAPGWVRCCERGGGTGGPERLRFGDEFT